MAVTVGVLSDTRRRTLGAVCDTFAGAARLLRAVRVGSRRSCSLQANDVAVFTAHQMGSCRMGSDPADSVADGRGELHDTEGVWIGDCSAFPTAPGVNPMISIMSLAHRTAANMLTTSQEVSNGIG